MRPDLLSQPLLAEAADDAPDAGPPRRTWRGSAAV